MNMRINKTNRTNKMAEATFMMSRRKAEEWMTVLGNN